MPVYQIDTADGRRLRVETPPGVTKQDVERAYREHLIAQAQQPGTTPPGPSGPPPGLEPSLAGSFGRGALQGFGSLMGTLSYPEMEQAPTAGVDPQLLEAAQRYARPTVTDPRTVAQSMPEPAGAGGQFAEKVGEYVGGSVVPFGGGLAGIARSLGYGAVGGAAAGATQALGGGELAQAGAGLAAAAAPSTLASSIRGLARGSSPARMRQAIQEAQQAGTTPTVAQAAGNRPLTHLETQLGKTVLGTGIAKRYAAQGAELGVQKAELLGKTPSTTEAGDVIQAGLGRYVTQTSKRGSELYSRALSGIPDTPATETADYLKRVMAEYPGAHKAGLVDPYVSRLTKTFPEGGDIPFDLLREYRSAVRERISSAPITGNKRQGQLKQLLTHLDKDINNAAKIAGKADELSMADAFWRKKKELEGIFKKDFPGAATPEVVFKRYADLGPRGATRLGQLRQVLGRKDFDTFVRTHLNTLGETQNGFNTETFLTEWNKLPVETKRVLFRGNKPLESNLERIATFATRRRQTAEITLNPSRTGATVGDYVIGALGIGGVVSGNAPAAVAAAAGGLVMSKLLSSPTTVEWLAKATKAPISALPAMMVSLRKIDPELSSAIDEFLNRGK